MELKLVLKDGTVIDLADASIAKHFVVVCADVSEFVETWGLMTEENLSEVQIMDGESVIQTIERMKLIGTQTVTNSDGTITGHFYTDGGDFVTDDYAQAGRILLGEGE